MPRRKLSASVRKRIQRVTCLLLDVDGVMTDGKIHLSADGSEGKSFDLRDGSGIKVAQAAGLKVGFISARPSEATARRARQLAVHWLLQGGHDKGSTVRELARKEKIPLDQICFVGDDLLDIPAMRIVGFPVAVADAASDTQAAALYVTCAKGGNGAVREVVEVVVRTQGLWQSALEAYFKQSSSPRQ